MDALALPVKVSDLQRAIVMEKRHSVSDHGGVVRMNFDFLDGCVLLRPDKRCKNLVRNSVQRGDGRINAVINTAGDQ